MKKITRKKHLEMRLQSVPSHPKPKVGLEQYTTPSIIASDLIWNAYSLGDVENRDIIDLGCGTGIFAIASALMGANSSVGIDIDQDSIDLACDVRDKFKLDNVNFICEDICDFNDALNADTLFQNPPFGSQRKADKGQDLKFLKKAIELGPEILYSFHMASTQDFLMKYYHDNNLEITHIFKYNFPIPKIYEFHTKEKQNVDVIVIRAVL
jgi:putative methylase